MGSGFGFQKPCPQGQQRSTGSRREAGSREVETGTLEGLPELGFLGPSSPPGMNLQVAWSSLTTGAKGGLQAD